jgi:lysosomal Pro-X carboxypeptidase
MPTRADWAMTVYGGARNVQRTGTNIIFSNGYLDPWSGGGVMELPAHHKSVLLIHIQQGAHHYDLRAEHPLDTGSS